MENSGTVRLARMRTSCGSCFIMSVSALKRSADIDSGLHLGNDVPLLDYNFEIKSVSDVVATQVQKRPNVGGDVLLEVPDIERVWLQATSDTSVESCELDWKPLNGEIDEEEGPDDSVPAPIRWSFYWSVTRARGKMLVLLTPAWLMPGELEGRSDECTVCGIDHR